MALPHLPYASCSIPLKLENPLNGSHGRWAGPAARRKKVRATVKLVVSMKLPRPVPAGPWHVVVTRVAPSDGLDPHDNLPAACKPVVDGVTDALGLKNDRSEQVSWRCDQRRGALREYAVGIAIFRGAP